MAEANPEVEFHLDGFIEQCNEMLQEHYNYKFDGKLAAPDIKVYPGGKYYKNFPRGNILEDVAKDVISVYGL